MNQLVAQMNDAVLQVLLILAFLAIGLISVTFPIYAISVNFLPQQKWESEKEREKRRNTLRARINQLTTELGKHATETKQVAQIREELNTYEIELEGAELRYQYLTAKGAVLVPVIALIFALLSAVLGIYFFYKDSREVAIGMGVGSSLFSVLAILRLYKTISAVEYGVLRPERTVKFEAGFGKDYEKTVKINLAKNTTLNLVAKTNEFDIENLFLMAQFPSDLEVNIPSMMAPNLIFTKYEDYTLISLSEDYLPKGFGEGFLFQSIPKKIGKYAIDVRVCAKGIYEYQETLAIQVV